MKKKTKMISIPQNEAYIICILTSLVFAAIGSYGSALFMSIPITCEKFDVLTYGSILFPVLFICFVMCMIGTIIIFNDKDTKRK